MHLPISAQAQNVLDKLLREASREMGKIALGLSKGLFRKLKPEDMADTYIAISREAGEFIYETLLRIQAQNIVEFGTSFGISTLYLGAAAQQTGGTVITSEILPSKCQIAQQNFEDAGLDDIIDLREGDALETLRDVPAPIDFLLLDGWNDLYLPLLKLLEPKFRTGTLVYIDNTSFRSTKPLFSYMYANASRYKEQQRFGDAALIEFIGLSNV